MARRALVGLLVALALSVIDGKATRPKVKWGQNKDLLFISIIVRELDPKTVSVSLPTTSDLGFRASAGKGGEAVLDLPLREDVDPESLKWEILVRDDKWGTAVLVTLMKKFKHRWDLLTSEPKKFKGLIDKDWTREDQQLEVDDDVAYAEEGIESGYILDLNEKNLEKTLSKRGAILANVRYPWCTNCKTQDDTFVKAAKAIRAKSKKNKAWKNVAFAVIDARENRALASRFGARCNVGDYNCEYAFLEKSEEGHVMIKAKWSDEELLTEVSKYLAPAVTVVKTPEEVQGARPSGTVAYGQFASESSAAFGRFKRVAGRLRGRVAFLAAFGQEGGVEVWPNGSNASYKFDGVAQDNGTELHSWIKPRSIPLFQQYDWKLRETYEELGLPIAKVYIDERNKNPTLEKVIRHAARRLAKQFIGKLAFVETSSTQSYELRDFGLNHPEVYPSFGIASNGSYNSLKYGFEVTPEVAESAQAFWADADQAVPVLADFCSRVLAGAVPESHESDAPQTNWTRGSLKRLTWKTYGEIRSPEVPLLVEVHGRYRSDHERRKVEASHLAEALAPHADAFTVASYDTQENYNPNTEFVREKYTSDTEWYWVAKDGVKMLSKPKKDAPVKTVVEFVRRQSGASIDVDSTMAAFEQLMKDRPPPATEKPPPAGGLDGPLPPGLDVESLNIPQGGPATDGGMPDLASLKTDL